MTKPATLRMTATILCALLMSACDHHVRIATPPPEYLTCAGEPMAPSLPERDGTVATEVARDIATLGYVLGLRSAWGDCAAKVAGVRAWAAGVE